MWFTVQEDDVGQCSHAALLGQKCPVFTSFAVITLSVRSGVWRDRATPLPPIVATEGRRYEVFVVYAKLVCFYRIIQIKAWG